MGTVRDEYKDYEEITIPVSKQAPIRVGEKRVRISDMDPLCSGAFKVCGIFECLYAISSHAELLMLVLLGIWNA